MKTTLFILAGIAATSWAVWLLYIQPRSHHRPVSDDWLREADYDRGGFNPHQEVDEV